MLSLIKVKIYKYSGALTLKNLRNVVLNVDNILNGILKNITSFWVVVFLVANRTAYPPYLYLSKVLCKGLSKVTAIWRQACQAYKAAKHGDYAFSFFEDVMKSFVLSKRHLFKVYTAMKYLFLLRFQQQRFVCPVRTMSEKCVRQRHLIRKMLFCWRLSQLKVLIQKDY